MLVPEPPDGVLAESRSASGAGSTSTIEQRGSRSASTSPGRPPPLPRSISRAPSSERASAVANADRVLGRLLDGPCAEESEALRFAQHLERLGPHLTPG